MTNNLIKPLQQQIAKAMQQLENDIIKAFHSNCLRRNIMHADADSQIQYAQDLKKKINKLPMNPGQEKNPTISDFGDGFPEKEVSLYLDSKEFWQDLQQQERPADSLQRIQRFLRCRDEYSTAVDSFDTAIAQVTNDFKMTTESLLYMTRDVFQPVRESVDALESALQKALVENYKRRTRGKNQADKKRQEADAEKKAYQKRKDNVPAKKRKWEE
jgi:hypothetical protein